MGYKTDLIEVVIDLVLRLFHIKGVSKESVMDMDLAVGQLSKLGLFLYQFFSDYKEDGIIYFTLHVTYNQGTLSYYSQWIGIGWFVNQIYLICMERQYVFDQYSHTFSRLLFHKQVGILQNGYALLVIHQKENLGSIFEGLKNKNYGVLNVLVVLFLINIFLDTVELLRLISLQIYGKYWNKKQFVQNSYQSKGGLKYFLGGFIVGSLVPTFVYLDQYLQNFKEKSNTNDQIYTFWGNFVALGAQFILSLIYIRQAKKQETPTKSKNFISAVYGLSFSVMNIYNSAIILVLVILHFIVKFFCCFWCRQNTDRCCGMSSCYCCKIPKEKQKLAITDTDLAKTSLTS